MGGAIFILLSYFLHHIIWFLGVIPQDDHLGKKRDQEVLLGSDRLLYTLFAAKYNVTSGSGWIPHLACSVFNPKKMRICILSTSFSAWPAYGHAHYILESIRGLIIEGFQYRVIPHFLYILAGIFLVVIAILWRVWSTRYGRVGEAIQ